MAISAAGDIGQKIVDRLVPAFHPERIYLIGSRARRDHRLDSDLDIVVVEQVDFGPDRPRSRQLSALRRALADISCPKDLLLFSESEFEYWKDSPNHIVADCLRDGILLYAR